LVTRWAEDRLLCRRHLVVDTHGGNPTLVERGANSASWFPDGERLLTDKPDIVDIRSRATTPLRIAAFLTVLSPDAKKIVLERDGRLLTKPYGPRAKAIFVAELSKNRARDVKRLAPS
jgi:hypothetical protein